MGHSVDAGLSYLYYLPGDTRRPEPASWVVISPRQPAPCVMEPADAWHVSVRGGWQARSQANASVLPRARDPRRTVFVPRSITTLDAPSPAYRPPLSWLGHTQTSASSSPEAETPQSPPRVETSWEVFEFLVRAEMADGLSLPELNLAKRLAKRLLSHSHSAHGQGLKVFYMAVGDTTLGACPAAASDPKRLIMHAALANSLLHHPSAADQLAIKRAVFATRPAGRNGALRSSHADKVAAWAPRCVGGTRLVWHRALRLPHTAGKLYLEPSEHYGHACHEGPLFERVAAFHANVLHLSGCEVPLHPATPDMSPLACRIEALRRARSPYLGQSPQTL